MEETAFSSVDLVGQCLFDREKATAFRTALRSVIRPDHVVLDLGTGSGILSLLAAEAGAKRVIAVERDPFVARMASETIRRNGYGDVVTVVVGDAQTIRFDTGAQFDVVLCEMLTTGLVDEFQVQAVNNLHAQGAVKPATVFLPRRQDTCLTLCHSDFMVHGFVMEMPLHLWKHSPHVEWQALSAPCDIHAIDFTHAVSEFFECRTALVPIRDGTANAVLLSSKAWVDAERFLEDTHSINPPVLIPIAPRIVHVGNVVIAHVSYRFGAGYQALSVSTSDQSA